MIYEFSNRFVLMKKYLYMIVSVLLCPIFLVLLGTEMERLKSFFLRLHYKKHVPGAEFIAWNILDYYMGIFYGVSLISCIYGYIKYFKTKAFRYQLLSNLLLIFHVLILLMLWVGYYAFAHDCWTC